MNLKHFIDALKHQSKIRILDELLHTKLYDINKPEPYVEIEGFCDGN